MNKKLMFSAFLIITALNLTGCTSFVNPGTNTQPAPPVPDNNSTPSVPGYSTTSIAYPTGNRDNSTLWIEKTYPNYAIIGQPYQYTINVTNLTGLSIPNVVISEEFPPSFVLDTTDPQGTMNEGRMYWSLGKLGPKASKMITVKGKTDQRGQLPCCTSATYDPPSLCVSMCGLESQMKLAMSSPANVSACGGIPIHFVVSNPGDIDLTNINIKGQLPSGVTVMGNNTLSIDAGTLKAGASETLDQTAQVTSSGNYQFEAMATAANGTQATADTSTTVTKPELSITADAQETQQYMGRKVSYIVKITNNGTGTAESAVLNAKLDNARVSTDYDYGSGTEGIAKWKLGNIEPGQYKTVTVDARSINPGTVNLVATTEAECSEPVNATASTPIIGAAGILIELTDDVNPIQVGDEETYIIKITNQGMPQETNIKLTATLDDAESYVSSSGATEGTSSDQTVTFAPVPNLNHNDVVEWRVVVKGTKAADARFRVSMISDQLTAPVDQSESTTIY